MVQKKSSRSRFVGEHATGIVVACRARHGRGIAAVEPTADGTRLSALMPRQQIPVVKEMCIRDRFMAFAVPRSARRHRTGAVRGVGSDGRIDLGRAVGM